MQKPGDGCKSFDGCGCLNDHDVCVDGCPSCSEIVFPVVRCREGEEIVPEVRDIVVDQQEEPVGQIVFCPVHHVVLNMSAELEIVRWVTAREAYELGAEVVRVQPD